MRFSLQDMVQQTLAESDRLVKQAMEGEVESDESKKKKKEGPPASPQTPAENASTAPERNEASIEEEKTSAVFVEKLASALEYCNEHFLKEAVGQPESRPSHTPPQADKGLGAGKGTGAVPTDLDTVPGGTGMQSTETGQATSQQQAPMNPPKDVPSPGQVNPDTALQTDMNDRPGGNEDWTNQDKMKQAQVYRIFNIMNKVAADAENPSKIQATVTNPHQSSPEGADVAEQGVPSQPGETSKQKSMIASNEAAINYKKQQAKAVPKARMGEVLDEPAQKKSTDPVLHNNLSNTGQAGVKIASAMESAAARALLIKIAQEGAEEGAPPEKKEKAEKLKEMLQAKQEAKEQEKTSMGEMPIGGGY